jgi:peptide deformylase
VHGVGRAVAAPQCGYGVRVIAMDMGRRHPLGRTTLHNPELFDRSAATFSLWDDCMSYPGLLARVRRHESVSLRFWDEAGAEHVYHRLDPAVSELLQHEVAARACCWPGRGRAGVCLLTRRSQMDHLDGVLMLDHVRDPRDIIFRSVFDANRAHFAGLVDYCIESTCDARSSK